MKRNSLPKGWAEISIKEGCEYYQGKTLSKRDYDTSGDIKIVKFRDVKETGEIDFENDEEGWVNSNYIDSNLLMELLPGTILLTNAAHSSDHIGKKVGYVENLPKNIKKCCFVGELTAIRSKHIGVPSKWWFYYLQTELARREITKAVEGAHLTPRPLGKIPLAYPVEKERNNILKIMRIAEEAIVRAKDNFQAAQRLKTSLMQRLFTKGIPGRHKKFKETKWTKTPENWEYKKLSDIGEISSGFTMGRDLTMHETVTVPYITVNNVKEGYLDLSVVGQIEVKTSELDSLRLKSGDILMTEGGDRDKLGRGSVWNGEIETCVYQNHIFRIRLEANSYLPELFHFLLQTYQAKKYFFSHAKQTSNLCTINSRELKRFPVSIPSADEQKEMIDLLTSMESTILGISKQRDELLRLKKSLLQNLLTVKVRVNMEAAHELLRGKNS